MVCDVIDLRCIFVNELFGSVVLTMLFATLFFFIVASKIKLGFETSFVFGIPLLLIFSLAITGFSVIYAFATLLSGFMLAWIINKIIGNR